MFKVYSIALFLFIKVNCQCQWPIQELLTFIDKRTIISSHVWQCRECLAYVASDIVSYGSMWVVKKLDMSTIYQICTSLNPSLPSMPRKLVCWNFTYTFFHHHTYSDTCNLIIINKKLFCPCYNCFISILLEIWLQ